MKKLLSALAAAVLVPFSAFAISLSDITDNPDQYTKTYENENIAYYVDNNSIESVRYSPPYYTIQGDLYAVVYPVSIIIKNSLSVGYDYNRSAFKLIPEMKASNPSITNREIRMKLIEESTKDIGITMYCYNRSNWRFDGSLDKIVAPEEFPVLLGNKITYRTANYFFYKIYNQYFSLKA